jgi:hypothetical protein
MGNNGCMKEGSRLLGAKVGVKMHFSKGFWEQSILGVFFYIMHILIYFDAYTYKNM